MTTPFEGYARARAAALGMPQLRIAVVQHPLADRTEEQLEEIASAVFADVAAALTEAG